MTTTGSLQPLQTPHLLSLGLIEKLPYFEMPQMFEKDTVPFIQVSTRKVSTNRVLFCFFFFNGNKSRGFWSGTGLSLAAHSWCSWLAWQQENHQQLPRVLSISPCQSWVFPQLWHCALHGALPISPHPGSRLTASVMCLVFQHRALLACFVQVRVLQFFRNQSRSRKFRSQLDTNQSTKQVEPRSTAGQTQFQPA